MRSVLFVYKFIECYMSALLCARVHVIGVFKPIKSIITFKYNDDDGDNIIVVRQYHYNSV